MTNDNNSTDGGQHGLPRPNVEWAPSGLPLTSMTAEAVKGILVNPLYAGAGPFPAIVDDAQWVAASMRFLQEEPPEQFLVNLLFVLRQSLEALAD